MSRAFSFKLAVSQVYHVSILRFKMEIQAILCLIMWVHIVTFGLSRLYEVQSKLKITLLLVAFSAQARKSIEAESETKQFFHDKQAPRSLTCHRRSSWHLRI